MSGNENGNQSSGAAPYKRRLRNFLLDARFQLKFAAYFVALALVISSALGWFLWSTTRSLFSQMNASVDAQSKAADTSRELGTCSLNNELNANMENPDFLAKLEEKSRAIDAAYDAEVRATKALRRELEQQQKMTMFGLIGGLLAFIAVIAFGAIMLTHRIVGPLFRLKRMAREVAQGQVRPPTYGLRPDDELQDLFTVFSEMVTALRQRTESDLGHAEAGAGGDAERAKKLVAELKARLDA